MTWIMEWLNICSNMPLEHTRIIASGFREGEHKLMKELLHESKSIELREADLWWLDKLNLKYKLLGDWLYSIDSINDILLHIVSQLTHFWLSESKIISIATEFSNKFFLNKKKTTNDYILETYIGKYMDSEEIGLYIFPDGINIFSNIEFQTLLWDDKPSNYITICLNTILSVVLWIESNIQSRMTWITSDFEKILWFYLDPDKKMSSVTVSFKDWKPYIVTNKRAINWWSEEIKELSNQIKYWSIKTIRHDWNTVNIEAEESVPLVEYIKRKSLKD